MGIKPTTSVLAYECHDLNLSSFLLGKMALEKKQLERQEKLEKMENAVSQSSDTGMSVCNVTNYHTTASLSPHVSSYSYGSLFFKYGVAFP